VQELEVNFYWYIILLFIAYLWLNVCSKTISTSFSTSHEKKMVNQLRVFFLQNWHIVRFSTYVHMELVILLCGGRSDTSVFNWYWQAIIKTVKLNMCVNWYWQAIIKLNMCVNAIAVSGFLFKIFIPCLPSTASAWPQLIKTQKDKYCESSSRKDSYQIIIFLTRLDCGLPWRRSRNFSLQTLPLCQAGLPDFLCYNTPKREKIYQITTNYTKCP
jgi:hypothetical protein